MIDEYKKVNDFDILIKEMEGEEVSESLSDVHGMQPAIHEETVREALEKSLSE